jgi:serine/threonine-protein kinase
VARPGDGRGWSAFEVARASLPVGRGPGRRPRGFSRGDPVSARSTSLRLPASACWGPDPHATVLENWGLLWIYHSIARSSSFRATNWQPLRVRARRRHRSSRSGCAAGQRSSGPCRRGARPVRQRQLARLGAGIVAINLVFWSNGCSACPCFLWPDDRRDQRHALPYQGGILSGSYYLQAALTFLAIFPAGGVPSSHP